MGTPCFVRWSNQSTLLLNDVSLKKIVCVLTTGNVGFGLWRTKAIYSFVFDITCKLEPVRSCDQCGCPQLVLLLLFTCTLFYNPHSRRQWILWLGTTQQKKCLQFESPFNSLFLINWLNACQFWYPMNLFVLFIWQKNQKCPAKCRLFVQNVAVFAQIKTSIISLHFSVGNVQQQ